MTPTAPAPPVPPAPPTLPELTRMCYTWQRRLRLQDWQVTVALVPDLDDAEWGQLWGRINYDQSEMEATLSINPAIPSRKTLVATVVHELLHLRLPFLTGGDETAETAINLLASAFLLAYPERNKRPRMGAKEKL